ncbi:hypothetical protein HYPSUDRAFT_38438 [Hypholoma sublateritium FD-334 SS-4]|uniref:Uncharacterized protein n=1 Tax=Hypholoma sublateritium (strain FD-334 SS-4) TaxID=945553 RepID=A0A0D2P821_HYPSF|nr:hypothetical protein HYPSUDRAFT_38438 [Hypholoma sublateritium FD-334 SS-4]
MTYRTISSQPVSLRPPLAVIFLSTPTVHPSSPPHILSDMRTPAPIPTPHTRRKRTPRPQRWLRDLA